MSERYIGIRYATAARFEPPVDVEFDGTLAEPVRAPQITAALDQLLGEEPPPDDEDCLQLNVFTPASNGGTRPVLVWIHGGAFVTGTAHMPWYDGSALAERGDVVVVVVNYRLGALGYLGESNCGTLDQVAALRWVHRHIATFGGDPTNVTLFGESAGGSGIVALCATPSADRLFARSWAMSPSLLQLRSALEAEEYARTFLDLLGADSVDQAREATIDAVLDAQNRMPLSGAGMKNFSPTDGTTTIPQPILSTASSDPRPLVIGTTRDEMLLFTSFDMSRRGWNDDDLDRQFSKRFGSNASGAIDTYRRLRPHSDPSQLVSAMQTDETFRVPAQMLAADRDGATWMYRFDAASTAFGGSLGSCHGSDIPYVFDNLCQPSVSKFLGDAPDQCVADQFSDALLAFARRADPGWAEYTEDHRTTQIFGSEPAAVNDPESTLRLLWQ